MITHIIELFLLKKFSDDGLVALHHADEDAVE